MDCTLQGSFTNIFGQFQAIFLSFYQRLELKQLVVVIIISTYLFKPFKGFLQLWIQFDIKYGNKMFLSAGQYTIIPITSYDITSSLSMTMEEGIDLFLRTIYQQPKLTTKFLCHNRHVFYIHFCSRQAEGIRQWNKLMYNVSMYAESHNSV